MVKNYFNIQNIGKCPFCHNISASQVTAEGSRLGDRAKVMTLCIISSPQMKEDDEVRAGWVLN